LHGSAALHSVTGDPMNLHRLDLNLLVVLDALLAEPSVTNAAQRLKVTQPAISMALKRLRAFFRDELFIRTPTGLRATPYAEQLREPVRRAIDIIDAEVVKLRKFDPATTHQTFHISTSDAGELSCLPKVLAALRERAPNASVLNHSLPPGRLAAAMEDGDVDAAIGYFPDLEFASFFRQKLYEHEIVCLVRRDHPIVGDPMTVEQFQEAEHAIVTDVGREQDAFEKLIREMGLKRRVKVRLAHLLSVPVLVANSDLIAVYRAQSGRPMPISPSSNCCNRPCRSNRSQSSSTGIDGYTVNRPSCGSAHFSESCFGERIRRAKPIRLPSARRLSRAARNRGDWGRPNRRINAAYIAYHPTCSAGDASWSYNDAAFVLYAHRRPCATGLDARKGKRPMCFGEY
jgi:DNA-binding transcriptional LysR family regulator